jgi:hypothetical protein
MVGRLDDDNAEDGLTVDVDNELGCNVGEDDDNNIGTSNKKNELIKDGFVVGNDADDSLGSTIGDTLGTKDEMIEGLMDVVALNFRVGPEESMDEGM